MSQTNRLADQIRRAFYGEAWVGDALMEILSGVNAEVAAAHPFKNVHSIWELVLHIAAWDGAVRRRTAGQEVNLTDKQNFPPIEDKSETAWRGALELLKKTHDDLVKAVYYMFSGIVQHELYHAGQILILKKAQSLEHNAGL